MFHFHTGMICQERVRVVMNLAWDGWMDGWLVVVVSMMMNMKKGRATRTLANQNAFLLIIKESQSDSTFIFSRINKRVPNFQRQIWAGWPKAKQSIPNFQKLQANENFTIQRLCAVLCCVKKKNHNKIYDDDIQKESWKLAQSKGSNQPSESHLY